MAGNGSNQYTKSKETAEELHDILSRVSSLETGVSSLSNEIRSVARSLEGFASETRHAIQDLATKMADGKQTPWGVIFAGMGVLLTVISLVGGLVAYGIQVEIHHSRDSLQQEIRLRNTAQDVRLASQEERLLRVLSTSWDKPDQLRYSDRVDTFLLRLDERLRTLEVALPGSKGK